MRARGVGIFIFVNEMAAFITLRNLLLASLLGQRLFVNKSKDSEATRTGR